MAGRPAKVAHIDCTQYTWTTFQKEHPEIDCNRVTFQKHKAMQLRNPELIPSTARSINISDNKYPANQIENGDTTTNGECKNLSPLEQKSNTTENRQILPISGKLPVKSDVPDDLAYRISDSERRDLIGLAVNSLRKHIPTQWQAAATTLERLVPQQFAKRVVQDDAGRTMGIRLVITDDPNGNRITTIEGAVK